MSVNYSRGESIIEILIVSFFLVTALVAFVSLTMMSVARNRLAKERVVATRLAQEGVEWLRGERDREGFDVMDSKINGPSFCIASTTDVFPGTACSPETCRSSCDTVTGNPSFTRWVAISTDGSTTIQFTVSVNWGNQVLSQQGILSKWEK